MKNTNIKIMVRNGFKATERKAYTDGNNMYVKIKGNMWEVKRSGEVAKYNKELGRMVMVELYDTERMV